MDDYLSFPKEVVQPVLARIFFILLALGVIQTSYAQETGGIPDEIIAVHPTHFPPYYTTDAKGRPSGFAIEVLNAVAKRARLNIRYLPLNWTEALDLFKQGKAHIIPNLGISEDRKKFALFSKPIEFSKISIFTTLENTTFFSAEDLSGYTLGVRKDSLAVRDVEKMNKVKFIVFDTFSEMLAALFEQRIDAFAYPQSVTLNDPRNRWLHEKIKSIGQPLRVGYRAIAVRKDLSDLHQVLNENLKQFMGTAEFRALSSKWLAPASNTPDLTGMYWLLGTGIFVFLLAVWLWARWGQYISLGSIKDIDLIRQNKVDRRHFISILFVMGLVALCIMSVVIYLLYQSSFKEIEKRLSEQAFGYASFIESNSRHHFQELNRPGNSGDSFV